MTQPARRRMLTLGMGMRTAAEQPMGLRRSSPASSRHVPGALFALQRVCGQRRAWQEYRLACQMVWFK